ncbi:RNA polymerase III C11 subunit [Dionaea muscipula]
MGGGAFGSEGCFGMELFCPCPTSGNLLQDFSVKCKVTEQKNKAPTGKVASCPRCAHLEDEYHVRSADKPMATFYRCSDCSHEWSAACPKCGHDIAECHRLFKFYSCPNCSHEWKD